MKMRRLPLHLSVALLAAVITPAAAAGMMQGVSIAGNEVSGAIARATAPDIVTPVLAAKTKAQPEERVDQANAQVRIATGAPRRLNVMAGNDDIAWANVGKKVTVPNKKK